MSFIALNVLQPCTCSCLTYIVTNNLDRHVRMNCYDNFELTSCEIINASPQIDNDKKATVQFVANMIQRDSREKTAFMEISTFERAGEHIRDGAWLYRSGEIQNPPGRQDEEEESSESPSLVIQKNLQLL